MGYVAGGVGVALRGEGVAPGELNGVEWLTWIQRAKVAGGQTDVELEAFQGMECEH